VTPAAISLLLVHLKRGVARSKHAKRGRHDRCGRVIGARESDVATGVRSLGLSLSDTECATLDAYVALLAK